MSHIMSQFSTQSVRSSAPHTAKPFVQRAFDSAVSRLSKVLRGGWMLAYRRGGSPLLDDVDARPLTSINPPAGHQWADPFPWHWQNQPYIFFEDIPPGRGKAHISVCELTDCHGSRARAHIALCKDYHLSFPFLFCWQGALFMMPQSGNKCLEIYRCARFPDEWRLEAELFPGAAPVDANLIEIDRTWWLFTTFEDGEFGENRDLSILYGNAPFGPWTPHALNPVVSDVRCARPAGRIFQHRDRYYRPAQDCSVRYGYAVVLNEIVDLTPASYSERQAACILPTWAPGLTRTHTLNHHGGVTVLDGYQRTPVFARLTAQRVRRQ